VSNSDPLARLTDRTGQTGQRQVQPMQEKKGERRSLFVAADLFLFVCAVVWFFQGLPHPHASLTPP
jgi:hypothetical protein